MSSADRSEPALKLDSELVGHDQELASTVDALQGSLPPGRRSDPTAPTLYEMERAEIPARPASPPRLPSGFFTRALPKFDAPGGLPWRSLLIVGLFTVLGSTALAWGTVFLVKPAAFAKAPPSPPSASARVAVRPPATAAAPVSVPRDGPATVAPRFVATASVPSGSDNRVRGPSVDAPKSTPRRPERAPAPSSVPPGPDPSRKVWFE
jgi:hypothetical protein